MNYKVLDLGLTRYSDCYNLQKKLLFEVKTNQSNGFIIITEHYPVITMGRAFTNRQESEKNLLVSPDFLKNKNVDFVKTDRGGDITYHCPGQLMLYPIIKIEDVHKYLHYLEDVVVALLAEYGIESFKIAGKTGAWTEKGKIASIGIGVSGWISYHGLSLNVDCDLTGFGWINPCGFKDIKITSMKETGVVKGNIKQRLVELFLQNLERLMPANMEISK